MQIGMKIYYDKATGNVIHNTGEYAGRSYVETTEDQDFASIKELAQRVRETVGVLKLEFGQYRREFAECESYRVNPETQELEFSFADSETNVLAGRLATVEASGADTAQQLAAAQTRLADAERENTLLKAQIGAQSERADFIEDVIAELALQLYS